MRFDSPHILYLIPLALGLAALLFYVARRKRARMLERFCASDVAGRLVRGISPARRRARGFLIAAAVALILFAIARPQYGAIERPLRRRGVEVILAVDCSNSMQATDIKPSRMARAREQLRSLLPRLQGHNVGVIAFAGVPIMQCPMTSDVNMALNVLGIINTDSVPVQGTAIGDAVRKAIRTYKTAGSGYKVLVLLTDGEDHDSEPIKAAEEAAKAGVRIYALGIGSTEGVPIRLPEGGFKEYQGRKVNTRLDFETLRKMALKTGGMAIRANPSGDLEIQKIVDSIDKLKKQELESSAQTMHIERFQWFLAPAVLLLAAEMLIGDRKRKSAPEAER